MGFPAGAPYHAILVAAAARDTASLRALTAQLSPGGGRLVAPVGAGHDQELVVLTRRGDEVRTAVAEGITVEFVRLVGSAPMPSSHVANACRASPRTQILKPGSEAHEH